MELLGRAGLEVVKSGPGAESRSGPAEEVLPLSAARRAVAAVAEVAQAASDDAEPSAALVRGDAQGEAVQAPARRGVWRGRPGSVEELNAQWHRLAVTHGVIGEDGAFLVDADITGRCTCCTPRKWTRVRLTGEWDLVGVLGERPGQQGWPGRLGGSGRSGRSGQPGGSGRQGGSGQSGSSGQPGFLTLSTDGSTLIGVTVEADEVRFVLVDRVGEWLEGSARESVRKAARETPEEREAAWAELFRGPEPSATLREMWADGLAGNPHVPDDLRVGLVGRSSHLLWRPQPHAVVDAAVAHPDWKVRQLLVEAQRNLTADHWERLVRNEAESSRNRWVLALMAADRREELTEATYELLATDPSARIRAEAARLRGLPVHRLKALAGDAEWVVRAEACGRAWPHLEASERRRLLRDPAGKVRIEALLRHHQDHPMPEAVLESEEFGVRAVKTCRLERALAERLVREGDTAQRSDLARNPHLEPDLVARLARDPDDGVRFVVSTRADLPEEQRAAVDIDFDPKTRHHPLDWVTALHGDSDAMRRLAASSHPLVRRSVARARRLPPDVVEVLAEDEDRVVQLFLVESCEDAPADMLLRVWQWWTGSLTVPDRPHGHPNFPRAGMLCHTDDPNPRMRQLALDDPESTAELVELFSRDVDEEVRSRAAADPRLTAASAVRLLDDPRGRVRAAAARHPGLPVRVLVRLLRDTDDDTARAAARLPTLPAPVVKQMLHRIQLPDAAGRGCG